MFLESSEKYYFIFNLGERNEFFHLKIIFIFLKNSAIVINKNSNVINVS